MGRLDGKVAIITGAARGQGETEARLFVAEGARVVLTDVLADEVASVAASLGDHAVALAHDITDPHRWDAAIDLAESTYDGLDILVNNAAIHRIRPLLAETIDDMRQIMDINLFGTVLGMQKVVPVMQRNGGGSIVNISSLAGTKGYFGHGAYGATKWALRGVSQVAAVEFGHSGIRVNTVLPGSIDTEMLPRSGDDEADAARFSDLPLGRHGVPSEIAEAVVFLASDAASYITGSELLIDGGSSAGRVPSGRA